MYHQLRVLEPRPGKINEDCLRGISLSRIARPYPIPTPLTLHTLKSAQGTEHIKEQHMACPHLRHSIWSSSILMWQLEHRGERQVIQGAPRSRERSFCPHILYLSCDAWPSLPLVRLAIKMVAQQLLISLTATVVLILWSRSEVDVNFSAPSLLKRSFFPSEGVAAPRGG